jgi:hypothetical protein
MLHFYGAVTSNMLIVTFLSGALMSNELIDEVMDNFNGNGIHLCICMYIFNVIMLLFTLRG